MLFLFLVRMKYFPTTSEDHVKVEVEREICFSKSFYYENVILDPANKHFCVVRWLRARLF